jgi:hypothetical protein
LLQEEKKQLLFSTRNRFSSRWIKRFVFRRDELVSCAGVSTILASGCCNGSVLQSSAVRWERAAAPAQIAHPGTALWLHLTLMRSLILMREGPWGSSYRYAVSVLRIFWQRSFAVRESPSEALVLKLFVSLRSACLIVMAFSGTARWCVQCSM